MPPIKNPPIMAGMGAENLQHLPSFVHEGGTQA